MRYKIVIKARKSFLHCYLAKLKTTAIFTAFPGYELKKLFRLALEN